MSPRRDHPRAPLAPTATPRRSRAPRPPRAFTLVEVTCSLAITSILLLAMAGALVLTTRAADSSSDTLSQSNAAATVLAQINADLSVATAITSTNPRDFTITVPDRDNDGLPETIEYKWTPGTQAIARSIDAGPDGTLVSDVQSIAYSLVSRPAAQPVESAEQVLASNLVPGSVTRNNFMVDNSNSIAEYVRPTLPAGTISWKITKVAVYLSQTDNSHKMFRIGINSASAALRPTTTVLDSVMRTAVSVPTTSQFVTNAIGPITGLAPGQGVCIVVSDFTGATVNVWSTNYSVNQPFNAHRTTSGDSGSTWSAPTDADDLLFILYGTYTTMVEP